MRSSPARRRRGLRAAVLAAFAFASAGGSAGAQNWSPQGPAPINRSDENGAPGLPENQAGAIDAVLTDPANANILYIGSVNGGVWKTANRGASWTPLTDNQASLSIGALAYDPTNPNRIIAGIGRYSAGGTMGGPLTGLLSINAATGAVQPFGTGLAGANIGSLVVDGNTILAGSGSVSTSNVCQEGSVNGSGSNTCGLFRSTDGANFVPVTSGLPSSGAITDLRQIGSQIYAGTLGASAGTGTLGAGAGVYVSNDLGKDWSQVIGLRGATNIKFAAASNGTLYVAVATPTGKKDTDPEAAEGEPGYALSAIYRVVNGQPTALTNVPAANTNPAGQGQIDLTIAVDPTNPNVIYVGGDSTSAITSTLVRGQVNPDGSVTWTPIADTSRSGSNAGGTTPHPDSRVITFDANGNLIETDDGGVYLRSQPQSSAGTWTPLNSNLSITELYAADWNPATKTVVGAAQDNGTFYQTGRNSPAWQAAETGDGVIALANGTSLAADNQSAFYFAAQNLNVNQGPLRVIVDDSKLDAVPINRSYLNFQVKDQELTQYEAGIICNQVKTCIDSMTSQGNSPFPFASRMVLNKQNPEQFAIGTYRLYIGTDNFAQEPLNADQSPGTVTLPVTDIAPATGFGSYPMRLSLPAPADTNIAVNALSYGTLNATTANALLAGTTNGELYYTANAASGTPVSLLAKLTGDSKMNGVSVTGVVLHPTVDNLMFAADGSGAYAVANNGEGTNGATGVARPLTLPQSFSQPNAVEVVAYNGVNALLVGGLGNVTGASPVIQTDLTHCTVSDNFSCTPNFQAFGGNLPNVLVTVLHYYPAQDVLLAGTFGRGTWTLYDTTTYFPTATKLVFGAADNDSTPGPSQLTDGTDANGNSFSRGLQKVGDGMLVIGSAAGYTGDTAVSAGTLLLTSGGSILGPAEIAAGAILQGTGRVGGTVSGAGTVYPGLNGVGTLTVGGYQPAAGGTLQIVLAPGAGNSNQLAVVGAAQLNGALALFPQPGAYSLGTVYNAITAGSVSGAFTDVSQPQLSSFLGLTTSYLPNAVQEIVEQTVPLTTAAASRNQVAVANALDSLGPTATGTLQTADNILLNSSPSQVPQGLSELGAGGVGGGDLIGNYLTGNIAAAWVVGNALDDHLAMLRDHTETVTAAAVGLRGLQVTLGSRSPMQLASVSGGGNGAGGDVVGAADSAPAGPGSAPLRLWTQGIGAWQNLQSDGQAPGLTQAIGGLIGGVDLRPRLDILPGFTGGLAFSYTNGSANAGASESATTNAYRLALYGTSRFGPGFVEGRLGYGFDQIATTRVIGFGGLDQTASGSPYGRELSLRVATGYGFAVDRFHIEPSAGIAFDHVNRNGYTETGAGAIDLSVAPSSLNSLPLSLGARGATRFDLGGGFTAQPEVRARYEQYLLSPLPSSVLAFAGAPTDLFTIVGSRPGREAALLDGGVTIGNGRGIAFFATYTAELRAHETVQVVLAGLRATW